MGLSCVSKARPAIIILVVLSITCMHAVGQDARNDKDLMAAIEHMHKINTFSQKYLKSSNQRQVNDGFMSEMNNDVVARAEKLLDAGIGANADDSYNVSNTCLNHTELFLEALTRSEQWALKMIDSMGKPASGILNGNVFWLGSYDECLAVEPVVYGEDKSPTHPYLGQYCIASYIGSVLPVIYMGMCFPDSCSQNDARGLAKTLASLIPGVNATTLITPQIRCQKRHLEYDDKSIAVMVVCSMFLAIMALATAYDIAIVYWWPKYNPTEKEYAPNDSKYGSLPPPLVGNGHVSHDTTPLLRSSGDDDTHHGIISNHRSDVEKIQLDVNEKKIAYQPGMLGQALLSFSVYTNASKILGTSQPSGTLTAVNGIRFISMTWVILGHTYAFGLQEAENIGLFFPQMMKRFTFQAINNATVSVDTFFVLSGLLVAFLSLKEMKKRGGMFRFKWGMYYFHRYWRLTPPYMLWLMVYVTTMKYWSSGPIWSQAGTENNDCRDTWWKNLLYINNVYESDNQCMGWSWYLANDMQFYVISPLLLIPLYYSPLWGIVSCLVFILANFIAAGAISNHYELSANSILSQQGSAVFMSKFYMKPWCRIGPYVVGFLTGYVLYRTDCKIKMPKVVNMIGWMTATVVAILVLYGLYRSDGTEPNFSVGVAALYNATARTAWGMCIAWVIFACATGYGGVVNRLLSWRAIIPLSRLTYCAYLVHPVVMYTYYSSRHTPMYWYDLEMIYLFLGHACLSYALAFVVSLAFESPMMGLEKVLLGRGKHS